MKTCNITIGNIKARAIGTAKIMKVPFLKNTALMLFYGTFDGVGIGLIKKVTGQYILQVQLFRITIMLRNN